MKYAKYFSLFVFIALLCYAVVGYYFLPLAGFQGDLTRTGMLPENQYGWRKSQPYIEPRWLTQASMQEADVLVIGDSFSDSLVWQSVLTKQGLKVRTEHWDTIRGVCADFMPWLKSQGFHGRYVVLQIIERSIQDGLRKSVACNKMETHSNVSSDRPRYAPATTFDPDHMDRSGRFSIGIQTAFNAQRVLRLTDTADFQSLMLENGARLARVHNGCALFSHTRCKDALFLAEDKVADLAPRILDDIAILNDRLNGITPIWAFVPNKSTTYLYPNKQFWNEAERRFHAPNLLRMTQQAIADKVVDLYPANNTHFSTTGYLMMGEEIYKAIPSSR